MITGFGNNISSALASDITANQTAIRLVPGGGAMFSKILTTDISNPNSPHGVYAKLTITDNQQTVFEICHLTTVSNDTLTVIRGQEGTTAKGWALNDVIANFATRGSEESFVQIEQLQGGDYTTATAGGTPNALTVLLPSTFGNNNTNDWLLKSPLLITPIAKNTGSATLQVTLGGKVIGTFPLYKGNKTQLDAGDILPNMPFICFLDSTKACFTIVNPLKIYEKLSSLAYLFGTANKLPYFNGADTATLTDITQVGRDIIGKNDIDDILTYLGLIAALALKAPLASPAFSGAPTSPTPPTGNNTTRLATTEFVQVALAKLIDSSPATLDTLNELAAALGDDPNFATTMTNALAGKQPLSTLLTAIAALATSENKIFYFSGKDSVRMTELTDFARNLLSKPDDIDARTALGLTAITSVPGAADSFPYFTGDKSARLTALSSFARNLLSKVDDIDSRTALGLGSAATRGVGVGPNQIPDMSSFTSSFGATGYQRLPGGLIIQWGISPQIVDRPVAITYPIPFPNRRLSISGSPTGTLGGNPGVPVFSTGDSSACSMNTWGSYNYTAYWIAIGF